MSLSSSPCVVSVLTLAVPSYARTIKEPGLHWVNTWGRTLQAVSTKRVACNLPVTTIVDVNGSPLVISAVLIYNFVDTMKAALSVDRADDFIRTQAEAVLKQVQKLNIDIDLSFFCFVYMVFMWVFLHAGCVSFPV